MKIIMMKLKRFTTKLIVNIVFNICCITSFYGQKSNDDQFLSQVGIKDSLYSETLNETRTIYIQYPQDYNPSKNYKYPVAYILDGEMFLPTLNEVQKYYSGGFTPEMILVGVSNSKHRTRDLTVSKIKEKYGIPFTEENGEADQFLDFLENELIPFIQSKYPVTEYRTLIGHSYGGLFTAYTLITKPDLFANYLAIDPSLDWDNQYLIKKTKESISSQKYHNKSLFISLSGQLHMQNSEVTIDNVMQDTTDFTLFARANITFSDLVKTNKQNGLNFNWKFYPTDIHGTIIFPSLMDGLTSMFKWYQMENTDKINSFDTPKEELSEIIKYREKKLKDNFGYFVPPYPEELLNMSGYMNLEMGQKEKAKMYFQSTIDYYPNSANAYDSMADYYERISDLSKALELVSKANKLAPNTYYQNRIAELKEKLKK